MKGTYWEQRQKQGRFDFAKDSFFDEYFQITWLIGDVFESLGRKVIGNKTTLYDKMRAHERGTKVPDLINYKFNLAFEVKGSSWGRAFKISTTQLKNYKGMRNQNFPLENPEIYYVLFAYKIHGKWKDYETEMNLINALCKSVRFAVILPLELVSLYFYTYPLVRWRGKNGRKYFGEEVLELINVKMMDIWDIQIRPGVKLGWFSRVAKQWNLPFGNYRCANYWSRQFRICQFGVSRFPITKIVPIGSRFDSNFVELGGAYG